jgi:hypothetical protein
MGKPQLLEFLFIQLTPLLVMDYHHNNRMSIQYTIIDIQLKEKVEKSCS